MSRFIFTAPYGWGQEHRRWCDTQKKVYQEVRGFVGSNAAYRLLGLYWFNPETRRKGNKFITAPMYKDKRRWVKLLRLIQEKMQDKVREAQLIIETNPSSNLLIGPLAELEEHPIFDLTLNKDGTLKQGIRVTVNTDNPGMLATSLAHEYYLLAETLLQKDVPESKVLEWIEWLRNNGKDCSFLRFAPDPAELKNYLDQSKSMRYKKLVSRMKGEKARLRF